MICPLCEKRKAKRLCPGIGNQICAQCCGTYREVTIECPSTCPYLRESRRQQQERGPAEFQPTHPEIEVSEGFISEREGLIASLIEQIIGYADQQRALFDPDVMDTLEHLDRTVSARRSGVIYESLPTGSIREGLFRALTARVAAYQQWEQRQMALNRLRDIDLQKALVFLVRYGQATVNGRPRSRAFIDALREMMPDAKLQQDPASALILP